MERYGIIDLGSNSVRLNIVQVYDNGAYNLLDQAKVMVRLSENIHGDKHLKQEPMDRTINAIRLFKKLLEAHSVSRTIAVATAAVRMAVNGQTFLDDVKAKTGIEFVIISGHEEAYYDYLGAVNSLNLPDYVMIDIGGGSTELALIENRQLRESISLPFGSVILTEAYAGEGDRKKSLDAAERYILETIKQVKWLKKAKGYPVVGMGGVVRTIGKIDKQKRKFPAVSLHNYQMPKKEVFQVIKKLLESSPSEIAQLPGASKDRSDILGPGVLPLKVLMEQIHADRFVVSGNGLRDGLFYETFFKLKGEPVIVSDVLGHSLDNVMSRYHINRPHAAHVAELSLRLFDHLSRIHDFTAQERKALYVAGLLHDIGMHIEYYNHQRHGFYLTINSRLYGLSHEETIWAAFMVALHREDKFKEELEPYKAVVDKARLERLRKLSLFIRMSEKLDRSESQVVSGLEVDFVGQTVLLTLVSEEDAELERMATELFSKEFEAYYQLKLKIAGAIRA